MKIYTEKELLKLAKRVNNTKRTYLLVDPLQAKHMPVSPATALEMMGALGKKLADKYSETRLVIGFAETATAIGAEVSRCISDECIYINTTREKIKSSSILGFLEEHSHAAEQNISAENLKKFISETETVIFVDDELSTGKTLINIINCMKNIFPELAEKTIAAASVINRVSDENIELMRANGIECESLLKIENTDYTKAVEDFDVKESEPYRKCSETADYRRKVTLADTRHGVKIGDYAKSLEEIGRNFCENEKENIKGRVLVLGTEEFMYPSIILGKMIEESGLAESVCCHASTRSPVGISTAENYPLNKGYKIHSFYENERTNYIYNIEKYDTAVIFTDTKNYVKDAENDLVGILRENGCDNIYIIEGESNVQHI